jgi:hypothetical protein
MQFGAGAILHTAAQTPLFFEHEHERRTPNAKRDAPGESYSSRLLNPLQQLRKKLLITRIVAKRFAIWIALQLAIIDTKRCRPG